MDLTDLRSVLGWATVLNWAVLGVWWATLATAREPLRSLHGQWFDIPETRFDEIHYMLMGAYKIGVWMLNATPYLALRIAGF